MRLNPYALTAVAAVSLIAASASAQSTDHAAMGHAGHGQATAMDHSAMTPRATPGQMGQAAIINGQGAEIGKATLMQGATGLLIKVEATGLTPGWHGIHIHATGQCAAPFTSAGRPHQPYRSQDPARPAECAGTRRRRPAQPLRRRRRLGEG